MIKKKTFRIPTPIIDLAIVLGPYLLGFLELKITGDSLILNSLDRLSFGEKFILYLVSFLLVEFIDYKIRYGEFVEKMNSDLAKVSAELKFITNKQESTQKKIELINHGNEMDKAVDEVTHPYFVSLINKRLKNVLSKNNVFSQTEYTNPSHANTFGAKGIKTTKESLRCVSFMPEYWEDKKDTEYIEQSMVEEDFKERDYLIQDDELLVGLYFEDEKVDGKHSDSKELITTDEILLLERRDEFLTNWACAKPL